MEVKLPLVPAVERSEYATPRAILQRPKATLIQYVASDPLNGKCVTSMAQKMDMDPPPAIEDQPDTSDLDLTWSSDQDFDECVYYHE
ncbi:hypothetical protein PHMEG_00015087 [Phytophthora megakarya]|uniref:Eukaryotic/viral aspartic protease n=1 Tax=Phytophthora megakarya TaxID=4795 RepID=A0A225W274_9STRA|nr:hypothetical protein PHMEG_00015087 [Phytophthora megakarya]